MGEVKTRLGFEVYSNKDNDIVIKQPGAHDPDDCFVVIHLGLVDELIHLLEETRSEIEAT